MKPRGRGRTLRRVEGWLWTGPLGHLLGGALDVARGLALYLRARKAGSGHSSR